jgi:hypothetical protein
MQLQPFTNASPSIRKTFRYATVEASGDGAFTLATLGEFDYGDPDTLLTPQTSASAVGAAARWDVSRYDEAVYDGAAVAHGGAGDGEPEAQDRKGRAAHALGDKGGDRAAGGEDGSLDQPDQQQNAQAAKGDRAQNQTADQDTQPSARPHGLGRKFGILPIAHVSRPLRRT